MIYQQENFLSEEELNFINLYFSENDDWERIANNKLWDNRCINIPILGNTDFVSKMVNINNKIENKIFEILKPEKNIYTELFQFCRSFKMATNPPHSDSTGNSGEDNGTSHRHFSSIVYLNKDFSGGELFFPNQQLTITPKPGLLAIFPSTHEYMHGITEIFDGVRFTLLNFWTYNIDQANAYKSLKNRGYYGN